MQIVHSYQNLYHSVLYRVESVFPHYPVSSAVRIEFRISILGLSLSIDISIRTCEFHSEIDTFQNEPQVGWPERGKL